MNTTKKIHQPQLSWLEDPTVFQVNRLPAHSDHSFYEDETSWKTGTQTLKQSLNGEWLLFWSPNPQTRPENFMEPGYDLSGFHPIQVPSHLELEGYGQIHYTNTTYPWDGHTFLRPPHIDWEHNPVGSYVKEFDLQESLLGKRICISFQGAEEAIYVWLNGHFIGYGEDSFTPSDFDITEYVKPTGNRLCAEVYKRSSAAWIEDQDFFRFSGIFREVFLYGKPEGHVENLKITADYDVAQKEGIFSFQAELSGKHAASLSWNLTGINCCIQSGSCQLVSHTYDSEMVRISSVVPWDVSKPNLYRFELFLYDEAGKVLEIVPYQVGFRHFEIKDQIMLLNGRRLLVNGVDRHEWNPKTGRAISEEDMRADIRIMKKNGINAVRTSHYPNQSLWYQLCDEAGICVMDETNLESHGTCMKMGITETSWNVPGSDENWLGCCLDRAKSMYERDKNHASILWWSAGNESHVGTVIQNMCEYFHREDPTRLVHYEGVFYDRNFDFITDIESRMYPSPESVREYLTNHPSKPMCLCEYMHDMGNSMGGLESYMKLREEFPVFHGGFLWDFIDQALYKKDENGTCSRQLYYGGDFCDRPSDYAFCANGLLFADRTEKPAMEEVRYWYLDKETRECFDQKNEKLRQICQNNMKKAIEQTQKTDQFLKAVHTDCNLGLYGTNFHYIFSFDKGGPVSLVVNDREQIYRVPKPTFWRAATENDKGCHFPQAHAMWAGADLYSTSIHCSVREFGDGFTEELIPLNFTERKPAREDLHEAEICYTYVTATVPETHVTVTYRVNACGMIKVSLHYQGNPDLPDLPVFGIQLLSAEKLEHYSWEGLSGETYPDRYKGAQFGNYESKVETTPYLVPQECQNHKDTYRMEAGNMIFACCDKPFHFSVLPYTPQQLESAFHQEELPESYRSVIRILGAMRGIGGIDSWLSDVESAYHISGKENIDFAFYMIPR